jgi:parvulin-like peptidyl-prolyl isomerase
MGLLREPLAHFLAIGVLLFVAQGALTNDAPEDDTITVGRAQIESLRAQWAKQRGRPPTPAELDGLIESHVREEVLYREAPALGLDRNDTIVRRRLAQKLEFLVTDAALPETPDETALRAYFEVNAERYAEPARLSFRHLYFSPDQRGQSAADDARTVLAGLNGAGSTADAAERGDRFMLGDDYAQRSEDEVARDFGREFASRLFETETGGWQGPIPSGYGLHLVRIAERAEARLSPFEAVRAAVERDYLSERTREVNAEAYRRLRERYEVVVETPGALAAKAAQ